MTQSVVICEGRRDLALLQYYMRRALSWSDVNTRNRQRQAIKYPGQPSRLLEKGRDGLTVMSAGGAGNIHKALENVIKRIKNTPPDESDAYDNIVVITDRDDDKTEHDMLNRLTEVLVNHNVTMSSGLSNREWTKCSIVTKTGTSLGFRVHVLVIPFDENGAMETFLLGAVSRRDSYDASIVTRSKELAQTADPDGRCLTKRSYRTKAAFDVFFSIRTAPDQFNERQNVFLGVDWENYAAVNDGFKVLAEL